MDDIERRIRQALLSPTSTTGVSFVSDEASLGPIFSPITIGPEVDVLQSTYDVVSASRAGALLP